MYEYEYDGYGAHDEEYLPAFFVIVSDKPLLCVPIEK